MQAWIEDAQSITDFAELDRYAILRTNEVQQFLDIVNLHSKVLVAPKGFGKTIILKLKRASLERAGYKCLPSDVFLDRPPASPPILANEVIDLLALSERWEALWQVAISIALIKNSNDEMAESSLSKVAQDLDANTVLKNSITSKAINTPFQILHAVLGGGKTAIYDAIKKSESFSGIFRRIHNQTAIFIDNIDEYLEDYINFSQVERIDIKEKYLKIWHNGQVGAWRAIRRLNGINPHIKIFISLRKEAYHYASKTEQTFANLKTFSSELLYNRGDILIIVEYNISKEQKSNLAEPDAQPPITSFVGSSNTYITNHATGSDEPILDYWLRHCATCPRDAIAIGAKISLIGPNSRDKFNVRSVINTVAAERAQSVFTEASPFFQNIKPDELHNIIKSNVLSRAEMENCSSRYQLKVGENHLFCTLYSLGLVGVIVPDRDHNRLIQRFASVGEYHYGTHSILPSAESYILHPSLSDFIAKQNPDFLKNLNKHNVIGEGLQWIAEEDIYFVAKGDIQNYKDKIMANVGAAQTFSGFWDSVFREHTRELDLAQTAEGDSMTLADRNPRKLIMALRGLSLALIESNYILRIRFGAHSGHWEFRHDTNGDGIRPSVGGPVSIAARLEPLGHAGCMLLTESFFSDARNKGVNLEELGVTAASASDIIDQSRWFADGVSISKPNEKQEKYKLYVKDMLGDISL